MTQAKASLFKWGWGCLFPGSENGGKSSLLKNRNDLCRIFLISGVLNESKLYPHQLLVHRNFPPKSITSTWCNEMQYKMRFRNGENQFGFARHKQGAAGDQTSIQLNLDQESPEERKL